MRHRIASRAALMAAALAVALAGCGSDVVKPGSQSGAEVTTPEPVTTSVPTATVTTPAPAPVDQGPLGARLERTVALRATPGGRILATLGTKTRWGSPRILGVVGRTDGWLRVLSERLPNGRSGWIAAGDAELLREPWTVDVDLSARRAVVRQDGKVRRTFTVAIGAPGTSTPTGRFAVTDTLRLVGEGPYGCCAIALTATQPNIPQGWAGGDRIAFHGTTAPASIGRPASHGCLRTAEDDLRWMLGRIPLGASVRITA